jgi:hypothetical protein
LQGTKYTGEAWGQTTTTSINAMTLASDMVRFIKRHKNVQRLKHTLVKFRGQCYTTFYSHKLQMLEISLGVCPWQAFPV